MTFDEVMAALEKAGTAQNRKVYPRHGVTEPMFGVSYGDLGKLRKQITTDHELAGRLWDTGNHDARILATMIEDPELVEPDRLEGWVGDLDNYVITDAFSAMAARTKWAREKAAEWIEADGEWIESAGWNLLNRLAMDDPELKQKYFSAYLPRIERDIHHAKNRVRYAMNGAMIAIGMRSDWLEQRALAVAGRVGEVEVDHGLTGCTTPYAPDYIPKARDRQRAREAKARG